MRSDAFVIEDSSKPRMCLKGAGMHRPLLVSIAAVMGLLVAHGPTMAQQAHCETSDWSFVLKKDAQEVAITVYDGAAERLFLFELSSADGVSVSVSYKSGSGA